MTAIVEPARLRADRVPGALTDLAAGRPVVLLHEGSADLVFAAELATPSLVAFAVRHTAGHLCAALPGDRADELRLPALGRDRSGTEHAVAVDASSGVSTGISATDRARTLALLARDDTGADEFARPGHVVPLRARPGGRGRAEAVVDILSLAGLRPVGGLSGLVDTDVVEFAREHGLTALPATELAAHRRPVVDRCAETRLPLPAGEFRAIGYRSDQDPHEHLALVHGDPGERVTFPVHVHHECALSILPTTTCRCRTSLDAALAAITARGAGVVLLLRRANSLGTCSPDPSGSAPLHDAILADLGLDPAAAEVPRRSAHPLPQG
ncbi:3,4-dihydroxy-2-butanone-4-phosphate synthase [Saccharopolyspora sp. MS10]|uniref:3,4-dihydroxy-2-butanone-4-phosphate synthase n=1 Tax=Saccharopolyspora sp. MS10 TaxID=3385973 RepID=UPI0039A09D1A